MKRFFLFLLPLSVWAANPINVTVKNTGSSVMSTRLHVGAFSDGSYSEEVQSSTGATHIIPPGATKMLTIPELLAYGEPSPHQGVYTEIFTSAGSKVGSSFIAEGEASWAPVDFRGVTAPVSYTVSYESTQLATVPDSAKPWWDNPGDGTDPLDKATFMQGIDKLFAGGTSGSSSGGGGGGSSELNTENANNIMQEMVNEASSKPSPEVMTAAAQSAANAARDAYDTATANATVQGRSLTVAGATHELGFWDVWVPGSPSENIRSVSPTEIYGISLIMQWSKFICTVIIFACLEYWMVDYMQKYVMHTQLVPQARGNTFAGTGGWITAGVAALIMTTFLATLPTLLTAAITDSFAPLISLGNALGTGAGTSNEVLPPDAEWGRQGWWMLNECFPIPVFATAYVTTITFKRTCGSLMVYCATFIRWVIP